MATKLQLSFACGEYDRIKPILDGRVQPEGVEFLHLDLRVEEIFFRQFRWAEFDVSELSLSSFVMSQSGGQESRFVAIPVFPSRAFRHGNIYISSDGRIAEASDLKGGKVGVPEFQMTAGVWQRGILQEFHGLPFDQVTYVQGGLEQPGREEKVQLSLHEDVSIESAPRGMALVELLAEREIDAIYAPQAPPGLMDTKNPSRRLFEDYVEVEKAYFRRTAIFPIMHVIAIKRDIYERHPWIAQALYKAFEDSRRIAFDELYRQVPRMGALKYMMPWLVDHVETTMEVLGENYWSYGVDQNQHVLETFLRYSHQQGLIPTVPAVEDLFVPECSTTYKV